MSQQFGNGFESLEDRTLLAANVTAVLSGGTLTITEDATANAIDVTGVGPQGAVEVGLTNGQTLQVTGGTTLTSAEGKFSGVTNIIIQGGAGNDSVDVSDVNIKGNLTALEGVGTDHMLMYGLTLGGNLAVNGGAGNASSVDITNVSIGGNLTTTEGVGIGDELNLFNLNVGGWVYATEGGGANDSIDFGAYGTFGSYIGGAVNLNAGTGANTSVNVTETGTSMLSINSNLTLTSLDDHVTASSYGGSIGVGGNLTLNVDSVIGGTGVASVSSYGTGQVNVAGNVTLNGGAGNDDLTLAVHGGAYGFGINQNAHGMTVQGNVVINGNGGSDTIGLNAIGSQATFGLHSTQHAYGFNSDTMTIHGSVTLNEAGVGNDNVLVNADGAQINVDSFMQITGGTGNDTVSLLGTDITTGGTVAATVDGQLHIGRALALTGGTGVNMVSVDNISVGGQTSLISDSANDFFGLQESTFANPVIISDLGGSDEFNIHNNVMNNGISVTGTSTDTLLLDSTNTIHGTTTLNGVVNTGI